MYAQVPTAGSPRPSARHGGAADSRGATPSAVAAWLGHADGGTLVLRTYADTDASEVDALGVPPCSKARSGRGEYPGDSVQTTSHRWSAGWWPVLPA